MSISAKNNRRCGAVLALLLSGCAVGPDFSPPDYPREDGYIAGGAKPMAAAPLEEAWWRRFGSSALDALMEEAMAANPGLEAAEANLQRSRHALLAGYGIFFPSVEAEAGAFRQQSSPAKLGLDAPPGVFNLFSLSGTVTYALDPFGGNRRLVEELGAERDLAQAEKRAAALSLQANIVDAVIARAAYRAEIGAAQALAAAEREQVGLAEIQVRAGTEGYAAVLTLKSQLAATEATLPGLAQKAAEAEDLLATLAGRAPGEWKAPEIELASLALPADLPVSLPSELVRQRPDILAAEATAHAASAAVGVATAAMLPSITLSGAYGSSATRGGELFTGNSAFWNFGADLVAPIFEGGSLWYRRKATLDTYRQAEALYRQTVLAAFAQVADSLQALDHDAGTLRAEEAAYDAAEQSRRLAQANYAAGLTGYLALLSADGLMHQAALGLIQAKAVRYQDTVALLAALGGGWRSEAVAER